MSLSMSPDPTGSRSGQSQSPPSGGPGAEQSKSLSFNSIFKSLAERRNARGMADPPSNYRLMMQNVYEYACADTTQPMGHSPSDEGPSPTASPP